MPMSLMRFALLGLALAAVTAPLVSAAHPTINNIAAIIVRM